MTAIPVDSAGLLPHGPAARFVTRVIECGADHILCEGSMPASAAYARDGRCATFVLLELGAQAAALLDRPSGADVASRAPRDGYLARARSVRCSRLEFTPGLPLQVWARRTGVLAPLFMYEVVVSDEAGVLLRGELSVYARGTGTCSSGGTGWISPP